MTKIRTYSLPEDTSPDLDDVLWVDKSGGITRKITLTTLETTINATHPATVYVETTGSDVSGTVARADLPFATIDAALDALPSTGGAVFIGIGTFAPVDKAKIKDFTKFFGSGKPLNVGNSHLDYGTVIQGPFEFFNSGIELHDLGIDSGTNVCTAIYSGTAQNGLVCTNNGGTLGTLFAGVVIDNVVCICKDATALVHGTVLEALTGAYVNNLTTYYGIHGIAIKCVNSIFSNLQSYGSANDNVIIKSDAYNACHDIVIAGLVMGTISGSDAGGLILSANLAYPLLENIQVVGAVARGTTYGVQFQQTAGNFANINVDMEMLNTVSGTINLNGMSLVDTVVINGSPTGLCRVGASGQPAFENSWSAVSGSGDPAFYKSHGRVYVSGCAAGGALGSVLWTMPAGYLPAAIERFACTGSVDTDDHGIAITTAGEVIWERGNASSTWIGMNGSYWVGN